MAFESESQDLLIQAAVEGKRIKTEFSMFDEPLENCPAWAIDDCVRALQVMANDERVSPDETARAWIVDCDLEIREEVVE